MNTYELSRNFFNWCFENTIKVRPIHGAIYFYALDQCNRFGWKDSFGFPTDRAMEALGIRNYRTYISALNDLEEFGFITMVERSKNQYTSNVIAIVKNTIAHTKALDKATQKHSAKQVQSIASIDKQVNKETKNIPTFDEFLSFAKQREPNVCGKDLKNKYDSWVVNGWKDGNNKKIINWKSKLINTIKYIDKIKVSWA